ncbi:MAG: DUF3616 domain-containing protein [Alphaproteobacteria bacterium]|nr:DUF3616 domain-containing protein [Alphaproteobacteria bacterium]
MRFHAYFLLVVPFVFSLDSPALAADPPECRRQDVRLERPDVTKRHAELSGVVLSGRQLITISNEGLDKDKRRHSVQIFEGDPQSGFRHKRDAELFTADEDACGEADFEALAREGETYFAITSHSVNRKKQKPGHSYEKNRKRLTRKGIETCKARYQLVRFRITDSKTVEVEERVSLKDMIADHPVLRPFAKIPNKENGIDIEGLAVKDGHLYVGFRGPVLRQNYVPVLRIGRKLDDDAIEDAELLFVNLGGRGIRGLAETPRGLAILAGPNGDEAQSFAIYFWDGRDQVGRRGSPGGKALLRCSLGLHPDDKPESLTFIDDGPSGMRFLLVFDGAALKAELRTVH